jgi:hypothetical protein
MTATSKPPVMGLAEAAKACGVSESTLRRRRPELKEFGAVETDKGWRIPVTALIAVGLMAPTTPASSDTFPGAPASGTRDDALRGELDALRRQLADTEKRAAVAEERAAGARALLAAHERIIETQALALRMLDAPRAEVPAGVSGEAPPVAPEPVQPAADPAQVPTNPEPRPSWWQRLTGAGR